MSLSPTSRKKHIIVVKANKVAVDDTYSPKKTIYVARKPTYEDNVEELETSYMGNASPIRPVRANDGNLITRSILGDPAKFDHFEKAAEEEALRPSQTPVTQQNQDQKSPVSSTSRIGTSKSFASRTAGTASRTGHTGTRTLKGSKDDERLKRLKATENPDSDPDTYLAILREEQELSRKQQDSGAAAAKIFEERLPFADQLLVRKENKVLLRWQERQRDWQRIQDEITRKLDPAGNNQKHQLMMSQTDLFRAKNEQYELLQEAVSPEDRYATSGWQMSLRGGGSTYVMVGHMFSGLSCVVEEKQRIPPLVIKPRPSALALSNFLGGSAKVYPSAYSWTSKFYPPPEVEENQSCDDSSVSSRTTNQSEVISRPKSAGLFEVTRSLADKKKKMAKQIALIRPKELSINDADALVVRSMDLFDWAILSSELHFEHKKTQEEERRLLEEAAEAELEAQRLVTTVAVTDDEVGGVGGVCETGELQQIITAVPNVGNDDFNLEDTTVSLQIKSSREVVFCSQQGTIATSKFTFTNNGTLGLSYAWAPAPNTQAITSTSQKPSDDDVESDTATSASASSKSFKKKSAVPPEASVIGLLQTRPDYAKSRQHVLAKSRPAFFCPQNTGNVLPGETVNTLFTFMSKGLTGSIAEDWILTTIPKANISLDLIGSVPTKGSADESKATSVLSIKANKQENEDKIRGTSADECLLSSPYRICLHWQPTTLDELQSQRRELSDKLDNRMLQSACSEVLEVCLRRVRQAVRPKDIHERKKSYFESVNYNFLQSLCGRFGDQSTVEINPQRFTAFEELALSSEAYILTVQARYALLRRTISPMNVYFPELCDPIAAAVTLGVSTPGNNFLKLFYTEDELTALEDTEVKERLTREALEQKELDLIVQNKIFPEKQIEVFDEISADDLKLRWLCDCDGLMRRLNETRDMARIIYHMEILIERRRKVVEREALKASKKAAFLAALDSDADSDEEKEYEDDDDEPEEEEEEDPEDGEKIDKSLLHPLVKTARAYWSDCRGKLAAMALRPIALGDLPEKMRRGLCDCIDLIADFSEKARADSEISNPAAVIPAMPSAYSAEGEACWAKLLAPPVKEEIIPDPKAKGKAPQKKEDKKKSGGDAGVVSEEQADAYHKALYMHISKGLVNAITAALQLEDCNFNAVATSGLGSVNSDCSLTAATVAVSATGNRAYLEDLYAVSSLRDEDVNEGKSAASVCPRVVFMRFSGEPFQSKDLKTAVSEGLLKSTGWEFSSIPIPEIVCSAYNALAKNKREALLPVVRAALGGARVVVLLHESGRKVAATAAARAAAVASGTEGVVLEGMSTPGYDADGSLILSSLTTSAEEIAQMLQSLSPQAPPPGSREYIKKERQIRARTRAIRRIRKQREKELRKARRRAYPAPEYCEDIENDPSVSLPIIDADEQLLAYSVVPCNSLAHLKAFFPGVMKSMTTSSSLADDVNIPVLLSDLYKVESYPTGNLVSASGSILTPENVVVLLVEDLSAMWVCPQDPPLPAEIDDDDVGPIVVGQSEWASYRQLRWNQTAPHQVTVQVVVASPTAPLLGEVTGSLLSDVSPSKVLSVDIPADRTAAILEIYRSVSSLVSPSSSSSSAESALWVEASPRALFVPPRATRSGKIGRPYLSPNSLVTSALREALLWASVIANSSRIQSYVNGYLEKIQLVAPSESVSEGAREVQASASSNAHALSYSESFGRHLFTLFPSAPTKAPLVTAVIGGFISTEKLRLIDYLLDTVNTIIITGELAIPFLAMGLTEGFTPGTEEIVPAESYTPDAVGVLMHFKAPQYADIVVTHRDSCALLRSRARIRGTRFLLPLDVLVADEPISDQHRIKCFLNTDPEARDEGCDYDGDTKLFETLVPVDIIREVEVPGFIYDVGPKTCEMISHEVKACDLLFCRGTVGACEVSSFQAGQRALVKAAASTPWLETADTTGTPAPWARKKQVVVVGDSSYEWFLRMVDPDGSETNLVYGDLATAGVVSYASRSSEAISGVLGRYIGPPLNTMQRRNPLENVAISGTPLRLLNNGEWVYNDRIIEEEELEDEEEDDDE